MCKYETHFVKNVKKIFGNQKITLYICNVFKQQEFYKNIILTKFKF